MKQWLTSHVQRSRPHVGKPSNLSTIWQASTADGCAAKVRGVAVGGVKVEAPKYLVELESPGTLLQNMPTCLLARVVGVCVFGVLPCCASEAAHSGSCLSCSLKSLFLFKSGGWELLLPKLISPHPINLQSCLGVGAETIWWIQFFQWVWNYRAVPFAFSLLLFFYLNFILKWSACH